MKLKSVLIYKHLQSWDLIVPLVKSANAAALLFSQIEYWRRRRTSLCLFSCILPRLAYLTPSSWHWRAMGAVKAMDNVHFIAKWNLRPHSYVSCVLCCPWQTKGHSHAVLRSSTATFVWAHIHSSHSDWKFSTDGPHLTSENGCKSKCSIQPVTEWYSSWTFPLPNINIMNP